MIWYILHSLEKTTVMLLNALTFEQPSLMGRADTTDVAAFGAITIGIVTLGGVTIGTVTIAKGQILLTLLPLG